MPDMTPDDALQVLYQMARRGHGNGPDHDAVREAGAVLQALIELAGPVERDTPVGPDAPEPDEPEPAPVKGEPELTDVAPPDVAGGAPPDDP